MHTPTADQRVRHSDAPDRALVGGWEPSTPVEDSLLRQYLHTWADLCALFATSAGGLAVSGPDYAAADFGTPSGYFNSATLLRPPEEPHGVVEAVEAFFAGGAGEALLWSAWPLPDLRSRGWRLVGHPPVLARPPARQVRPPAAAVHVRPVRDPDSLAAWERVAVTGYPLPELTGAARGALADPRLLDDDRLRLTLGHEGRDPVSLGSQFRAHGISCFALGVTLPQARGRGHWLAHAFAPLQAAPDTWSAGVFSDFSRPLAERIGFVPLLRLTLWALPRPGRPH
jgi:hypothetical protein